MKKPIKLENTKRINHKEEFELCYMRHQYLRRAEYRPTIEEIEKYRKIAENFAKNTFYVYKNLFLLVGLDLEDVLNTAQVYVCIFISLFALERNPKKKVEFENIFKGRNSIWCTEEDILNKNKANFTCFLKQRLQDLVRVCNQKSKNIRGLISEDFLVFTGKKRPPLDIEDLLDNYDKYNYKPLETTLFKNIKKNINNQEGPVFLFKNNWYVCVPIKKKTLTINDFICNGFDPRNNLCNMTPEEFYDNKYIVLNSEKFKKYSKKKKIAVVKTFVYNNENNPELEEEIKIAKDYLQEFGK